MTTRFALGSVIPAVVLSAAMVINGFAQEPAPAPAPAPSPAPGGGTPGGGGGGGNIPGGGGNIPGGTPNTPGRSRIPGLDTQDQTTFPEMQRPIYLSGKVMMDDGTPPPDQVVIERICNGIVRPEGYTDSKGRFHIELGRNSAMMADASVSSDSDMGGMGGMGGRGQQPGRTGFGSRGFSERDLMGCEVRASLAGFRSDVVNLSGRRALDNPDLGTIVLHRLAKVDGFTFSGTTSFAPKDARKAFDKGRELHKKKKLAEAEKELAKAVELYPKFAVAWYELGTLQQEQDKIDGARKSYEEAIKADAKYISPYGQLMRIAASEKKWEEAAGYSDKLIKLNPFMSAEFYFTSSVVNLNLQKLDVAEEQAREALKLDAQKRIPRINYLLGVILAQRQDYKGAADNLRAYLVRSPNGSDVDNVKKQLADIEQALGKTEAAQKQDQ